MTDRPSVSLIHDWLTSKGGAERVLAVLLHLFPDAPVHTLVYAPELFMGTELDGRTVKTSFLNRLPWARSHYRSYLPLMPLAIEHLDLCESDIVLSMSSAVAHGVLTRQDQLHIDYIMTPMRYIWSMHQEYLRARTLRSPLSRAGFRVLSLYLRMWDEAAAQRVDHFVAISQCVSDRVLRAYHRKATVIHPPVDVDKFTPRSPRGEYYITVSRLVPYKRVSVLVEAFNQLEFPLVVVGEGPEKPYLERSACSNVQFLGWQSDEVLVDLLGRARAFVFAAEEDFGIAPVEAQAAGCPVIAYGRGGVCETVIEGETGIFFDEPSAASLLTAIKEFEAVRDRFDVDAIRRNAERFCGERFETEFLAMIDEQWAKMRKGEGQWPRRLARR